MLVARADWRALFMETRLHICRCVIEGAGVRGHGALLTGRTVGVGTTDGGVSIRSGREASRCKEKAGWILKIVGDEESAREMCKDIEDKSSSGIIAETLNRITLRKMTEGARKRPHT